MLIALVYVLSMGEMWLCDMICSIRNSSGLRRTWIWCLQLLYSANISCVIVSNVIPGLTVAKKNDSVESGRTDEKFVAFRSFQDST